MYPKGDIMTKGEMIIKQILSGRWILTCVIGFVFAYSSMKGILKPEDVKMIIVMGMTFYFMKNRNGHSDGDIDTLSKPATTTTTTPSNI